MAGNVSGNGGNGSRSRHGKGSSSNNNNTNNNKGYDHSKVSNPAYEPGNPLQVITWMCQTAKKYSTI